MKANISLAVIVIVFSGFFLIQAVRLPMGSVERIGPGAWPLVILCLMLILGVVLLIKELIKHKKHSGLQMDKTAEAQTEETPIEMEVVYPYKHWIVLAVAAGYVLVLPVIGFIVATPLLMLAAAFVLGLKHIGKLITLSLTSSLVFNYIFIVLLSVPLPRGAGIFRSLSIFVY
ncbi:Tripartite tricarboxylate transporter TctB family protein [Alteribacillus persepolensis]|uniref:Tripartite tricarboxylate transporter TctB family protein n=1 Tax=Alteribacillus persepolensis TaxID=568899 RepID=A0A1G8EFT5_9BACI|nr:tripartite tricarboxylate transporter TctB family protein [Alteribacillus persepolensis]SDH68696.1 Tripartite tricarboxylate transporter TctB family protein [Alteribacillus persepolensis]